MAETPERADPEAGHVQWHSSEEDGGPDVGILLGLGDGKQLWLGEDSEFTGMGFIFYAQGQYPVTASLGDYDEIREVIENHVAPAIRALSAGPSA